MKRQELYNILIKDKVIYSNLTELEYFERLEDLSIEYYQTGIPHPNDIQTQIIKEKT